MSRQSTGYSRLAITADESKPDSDSPKVQPMGFGEVAWYLAADTEARTCTIVPWYLRDGEWHKGTSAAVTGSTVVMGYTLGRDCAVTLEDVVGTWTVGAELVSP